MIAETVVEELMNARVIMVAIPEDLTNVLTMEEEEPTRRQHVKAVL